jgi:hypothetical protein
MDKNTSEDESELLSEQKPTKQIGGLVMKELNKSGSILVYSKLDSDKFDKYNYTYNKKKITIGVNLDNLLIILKCMTNLDKMTWALDDEDINKLIIILENTDKKEKKIFRLNLSDLDEEKIEVDTIEFPYSAYFPSSDFHKYCKDMSLITEKIEIKWICEDNLKRHMPDYRSFFKNTMTHIWRELLKIKAFIRKCAKKCKTTKNRNPIKKYNRI